MPLNIKRFGLLKHFVLDHARIKLVFRANKNTGGSVLEMASPPRQPLGIVGYNAAKQGTCEGEDPCDRSECNSHISQINYAIPQFCVL